ncbi:hypothetical protein [Nitrosomonas ureae]|uniref:Uncharacterized protein n=1 Tax=Nitrosomonas ureae TaxID=44577 RepID=A0A286A3W0_9PROT|nr:hypothetical protein [Nitrosomonas ureae]SOD16531.1 hypothetical protein SAMN06297164_0616 [Nitrosomonas ureae]SOD22367.1 hypothetical protein SAMN06297164_3451 [Nitrosomonas ureae]
MMDILTIILICLAVTFVSIFILKWIPKKTFDDTEGRKISIDTKAEKGTDKLLRHLDERENTKNNAELMLNRNSESSESHVLHQEKKSS